MADLLRWITAGRNALADLHPRQLCQQSLCFTEAQGEGTGQKADQGAEPGAVIVSGITTQGSFKVRPNSVADWALASPKVPKDP